MFKNIILKIFILDLNTYGYYIKIIIFQTAAK